MWGNYHNILVLGTKSLMSVLIFLGFLIFFFLGLSIVVQFLSDVQFFATISLFGK